MNRWNKTFLLAAVAVLLIAATKLSDLTQTLTLSSSDVFLVTTGSVSKVSRSITATNLINLLWPYLANDTINSNKLDAATRSMFAGAGWVPGTTNNGAALTNLTAANLNGTIPFTALPSGVLTNNIDTLIVANLEFSNLIGEINGSTNIAAGTITTNRLDATAYAAFMGPTQWPYAAITNAPWWTSGSQTLMIGPVTFSLDGSDVSLNSGLKVMGGSVSASAGFIGSGASLTGLTPTNLTGTGTIPLAALPSAVVTNNYTSTFSILKDSAAALALGTTANASSFITFNNNRGAIGKNGDFIALMGDVSRGIKLMTGVSPADASGGTAYLEISANGATTTLRSTAVNFSGSATVTNTVTATNFVLSAPQWVDLIGIPQYVTGGPNPALTAITNGSVVFVPAYQQTDLSYWQFQLPHNVAVTNASFTLGTATNQWHLEPHVHFVLNQNAAIDSTHSNVTFQCTYRIADINGNLNVGTNTATMGVSAVGKHYILELGAITNGGPYGISAVLSCELKRIASAAQDLSLNASVRDVGLIGFDLHTPVGNVTTIGSRNETSQ